MRTAPPLLEIPMLVNRACECGTPLSAVSLRSLAESILAHADWTAYKAEHQDIVN